MGCAQKQAAPTYPQPSGGPGPSAAPMTTPAGGAGSEVCEMLTVAEVGGLTGARIVASRPDNKSTPTEPNCDWLGPDDGIVVHVGLNPAKKNILDDFEGYQRVPGIGEAAIENHGILSVLYKGTELTVIFGGAGAVEIQKQIAARVIEKLDQRPAR